jgi:hypothetical protein
MDSVVNTVYAKNGLMVSSCFFVKGGIGSSQPRKGLFGSEEGWGKTGRRQRGVVRYIFKKGS